MKLDLEEDDIFVKMDISLFYIILPSGTRCYSQEATSDAHYRKKRSVVEPEILGGSSCLADIV